MADVTPQWSLVFPTRMTPAVPVVVADVTVPQWSLVFPTRMTSVQLSAPTARYRPQWSLVFPTRMTPVDDGHGDAAGGRNGAWSFRPG